MIELWMVVLFVLCFGGIYISNKITSKKIRRFDKRLTDFEKIYFGDLYRADVFEDEEWESKELYILEKIPIRLEKIRFCYLCPLYQNRELEDTKQTTEQKITQRQ